MHILIAPNAFKNSLSAEAAATAILQGLEQSRLRFTAECFPVGDGGDGTGDLLMARLDAGRVEVPARDPFGRSRIAYYGFSAEGQTAIVEMANASGLRLLNPDELNPLCASSHGTGELILASLEKNPRHILIGMGGSATVDGGTGILAALGVRFLNPDRIEIVSLPAGLRDLGSIDISGLDPRLKDTGLTVFCDVNNPLLGPEGAAAVFGPQKGASPRDVEQLEAALVQLSNVIREQFAINLSNLAGGGTAGGAAAGLYALLGARLVNGIDEFIKVTGFEEAVRRADWVITGEGSIDGQTLKGKGPYGVAVAAKRNGRQVIGLAGCLPQEADPGLSLYFDVLLPINHKVLPLADALAQTAANLTATARAIGNLLAAGA